MSIRGFIIFGFFAAAVGLLAAASPCSPLSLHAVSGAVGHHAVADLAGQAGDESQCHHDRSASQRPLVMLARLSPELPAPMITKAFASSDGSLLYRQAALTTNELPSLKRWRQEPTTRLDAAFARTGRLLI